MRQHHSDGYILGGPKQNTGLPSSWKNIGKLRANGTMTEIFNMGGYGAYVWPAWGIAVLVLGGLIFASLRTMRARERELTKLETTSPPRRRRDQSSEDGP